MNPRKMRWMKNGGYYITRNVLILTVQLVLLWWSDEGGYIELDIQVGWEKTRNVWRIWMRKHIWKQQTRRQRKRLWSGSGSSNVPNCGIYRFHYMRVSYGAELTLTEILITFSQFFPLQFYNKFMSKCKHMSETHLREMLWWLKGLIDNKCDIHIY